MLLIIMPDVKFTLDILNQMPEWIYPTYGCSLFILPNGKMVGIPELFGHKEILRPFFGHKLTPQESCDFITKANLIKLTVNDILDVHITIPVIMTKQQKDTLKIIVHWGKYDMVDFILLSDLLPNAPDMDYILPALDLDSDSSVEKYWPDGTTHKGMETVYDEINPIKK